MYIEPDLPGLKPRFYLLLCNFFGPDSMTYDHKLQSFFFLCQTVTFLLLQFLYIFFRFLFSLCPHHLQQIYSTYTAQFCHQFQLLAAYLIFFSHSTPSFALFFLSEFSAWSLAKQSTSYLDEEALNPTIHE